jgi:cytochrome b pre-mRNA-processing protein 3
MGIWPFRRSRARTDAQRLLAAVQAASRRPILFGAGKAPDTLEGRFEVLTLHAGLALLRLRAEPEAAPLAQAFTDALFRSFDAGLREHGVGDTSVPKRMHKLAGDFYGRLEAYGGAITDRDEASLAAAIVRNIRVSEDFAGRLAPHMVRTASQQAGASFVALFDPDAWPDFPG